MHLHECVGSLHILFLGSEFSDCQAQFFLRGSQSSTFNQLATPEHRRICWHNLLNRSAQCRLTLQKVAVLHQQLFALLLFRTLLGAIGSLLGIDQRVVE